jgi:hypothetical protein
LQTHRTCRALASRRNHPVKPKVFCFFFSKKKILAAVPVRHKRVLTLPGSIRIGHGMRSATALNLVLLGSGLSLFAAAGLLTEENRLAACEARRAPAPPDPHDSCHVSHSGGGGFHGGGSYSGGRSGGSGFVAGGIARGGFGGFGAAHGAGG